MTILSIETIFSNEMTIKKTLYAVYLTTRLFEVWVALLLRNTNTGCTKMTFSNSIKNQAINARENRLEERTSDDRKFCSNRKKKSVSKIYHRWLYSFKIKRINKT